MNIKICGLFRSEDIEAVNESLPDYIGFVFAKSHRQVSMAEAADLKNQLDKRIKAVGVFVNTSIEEIKELCRQRIIDVIQLHGDEDKEYIEDLKRQVACPIIKAVRVKDSEDILMAEQLPVDYLLLDTFHKDSYGGTGESFDWAVIPNLSKPYFLAGGLSESNLLQAKNSAVYCLDVSSGAETQGLKDPEKIHRLVRLMREN